VAAEAFAERLRRLVPREDAEQLLASRGQMAGERDAGALTEGADGNSAQLGRHVLELKED
jgi:hypothetical protein